MFTPLLFTHHTYKLEYATGIMLAGYGAYEGEKGTVWIAGFVGGAHQRHMGNDRDLRSVSGYLLHTFPDGTVIHQTKVGLWRAGKRSPILRNAQFMPHRPGDPVAFRQYGYVIPFDHKGRPEWRKRVRIRGISANDVDVEDWQLGTGCLTRESQCLRLSTAKGSKSFPGEYHTARFTAPGKVMAFDFDRNLFEIDLVSGNRKGVGRVGDADGMEYLPKQNLLAVSMGNGISFFDNGRLDHEVDAHGTSVITLTVTNYGLLFCNRGGAAYRLRIK